MTRMSPRQRGLALVMLLVVYILNFVDRQIFGILAQPIKLDLHLSDTQLGALGGLAFALLYSVLGVPLAMIADRTSRSGMIALTLGDFSLFSALCGAATGYWSLFVLRLGVGVGEAGGVAPSYALIGDTYPPARRARAMAIYSLGIPLGLTGGALLGGLLAAAVSWRWAFAIVGLAGLVVAPVFKLLVRDPPRAGPVAGHGPPPGAVFAILARKPSFWLLSLAASSSSLVGYGLAFWLPSLLLRSYGLTLVRTSEYFGSLVAIGGSAGVLGGDWLADRFGRHDRGRYAMLVATAWLLSVPSFLIAFLIPTPGLAWPFFLLPNALNILWIGPVSTAIQHLVPPPMRATASACFLLINNLIGLGLGALVLGAMSDAMAAWFGADALRYSAMGALSFYVVAAVLVLFAVRPLRRDWIEDRVSPTIMQGE